MKHNTLKNKLKDTSDFVVVAELVGGPGFKLAPIEKFVGDYKEAPDDSIPAGFDFVGITLPQNPGGVANIDPSYVLRRLHEKNLLDGLDFIPHVSCKDHNTDAIVGMLTAYKACGVESILALTGDKPVKAKGVFELESIGLLDLLRDMNSKAYLAPKPENLESVHQFFAGAAVSPFKYTEASQMQQYYKMEKKIASGAGFFITQLGWDWKKSVEFFSYCRERNIDVPIIGNVYMLSTSTPAPRLMHDIQLPGCFVSDDFLEKLYSESIDEHLDRAAQQVAMYKALGAAGVDVGGVHSFDMLCDILERSAAIGKDWEKFKDNLCWPAENPFYLYEDSGKRVALSTPRKRLKQRFFTFTHRAILDRNYRGFKAFRGIMSVMGTRKGKGAAYSLFNASEKAFKYLMFECQECGDCYLPENFGLCTIGGCEKGMDNAPCGDSTADGMCGNNLERVCIGERIYDAAAAEKEGREKLAATINKPRIHSLEHTSSILNTLFGKDHTGGNPLTYIGNSLHVSIPKLGAIMRQLSELGDEKYLSPSGPLNYMRALIVSQGLAAADYIAVNLDALEEDDTQKLAQTVTEYVALIHRWGQGVPVCIDSRYISVVEAGLREWYGLNRTAVPPLVRISSVTALDDFGLLRKIYPCSIVVPLTEGTQTKASPPGRLTDAQFELAEQSFAKATAACGFLPGDIILEVPVVPVALDTRPEDDGASLTRKTFETVSRIRSSRRFKGVRVALAVEDSGHNFPARKIGLCRAYTAKAMEYGMNAVVADIGRSYGTSEPDAELLQLVEAYAEIDGSSGTWDRAEKLLDTFCRKNAKPSKGKPAPMPKSEKQTSQSNPTAELEQYRTSHSKKAYSLQEKEAAK
jgi:methylenetetrahydrofolate reductase (NADPH)